MDDALVARARGGDRRPRLHDRRGRDRARADRRTAPRPRTPRRVLRSRARQQLLRGLPHAAPLQPARVRADLRARPRAPKRAADRRRRARPGLPDLVAVVDRDPTGRDRAADPRRRPADPDPQAAPAHRVQLDVGAHRLHRGERRDAHHSPVAPRRPLARLRRRLRLDARRDARGFGVDLARQPLARRRREHHRRDAHGHRDELLRGLHPPAGEPAARAAARDRRPVLAAAPRARRLRRLQHADRPHQQAVTRTPACSTRSPARRSAGRRRWSGTEFERSPRRGPRRRSGPHAEPSRRPQRVQHAALRRVRGRVPRSVRARRHRVRRAHRQRPRVLRRSGSRRDGGDRPEASSNGADDPGPGFPGSSTRSPRSRSRCSPR